MLTATYSFIAITAEQTHARAYLQKLQQRLQAALKGAPHPDVGFLDAVWNKLARFDTYCRHRKVEVYLIPALRNVGGEADALIEDLEGLSAAGAALLRSVGERMAAGGKTEQMYIQELCREMECYCRKLSIRLDKEEQALLPFARRYLSAEAWFSIAAKLLADPANVCEAGEQRRIPSGAGVTSAHGW